MAEDTNRTRLIAVVVTYNRREALEATLARLFEAASEDLYGVVVVDNASTDGTGAWLASLEEPRLTVVPLEENLGGAGGFAVGMEVGCDLGADWLVLMDDDARPMKVAGSGVLQAFHDLPLDDWDGFAASVYLPGGEIAEMNRPSRNPFWKRGGILATLFRGRDGYHIPPEAYHEDAGLCAIDVTSFVGFFVSCDSVKSYGLPEHGLFLYGDDAAYTLRMRRAGARFAFAPQIMFEHACETFSATDQTSGRIAPLWKVYFYHRNLLIVYRMAAGPWFWPALFFVIPRWLLRLRAHSGERGVFLSLFSRAVRDGLTQRTDVPLAKVQEWVRRGSGS